jgi:hypothetical protein
MMTIIGTFEYVSLASSDRLDENLVGSRSTD